MQCAAAYDGALCDTCAPSYYKTTGSTKCFPCGSSSDQNAAITLTIIAALVGLFLLALGVVFLTPLRLAYVVQGFLVLQGVALVGVNGSRDIPFAQEGMSSFFSWLNIINFDIAILRPGCVVPSFTFVSKFGYTILFMVIGFGIVVLACVVRFIGRIRQTMVQRITAEGAPMEEGQARSMVGAWRDATQRLQHATLILLSIFYLRLAILEMQAFQCAMYPDPLTSSASDAIVTSSLYLTSDLQSLCYKGRHLTVAIVASILLPLYTAFFPLWCYVLLMRAFGNEKISWHHGIPLETFPSAQIR